MSKNKLALLVSSPLLIATVMQGSVTVYKGWNLLGSGDSSIDLSSTFSQYQDISYVWTYYNGKWNAYGNNSSSKQKIIDSNLTSVSHVQSNSGFWINNNGNSNIEINLSNSSASNNQIQIAKNWNLLSAGNSKIDLIKTFGSKNNIEIIWTFDNATQSWGAYSNKSSLNNLMKTSYQRSVSYIERGSAYWLLNNGSESTIK